MNAPDLSIVIPALNEREALPGLLDEIAATCEERGLEWEAIVVDDGSTDGTTDLVEELGGQRPQVRGVRLRRNFGKSAALAAGFDRCSGKTIVTIDGDGQDDPADIPVLLDSLSEYDLVSGWKRDRQDPTSRRLASKVFNWFVARFTGVEMHDMNCGFKAYRGECARSLEVYGELHRFLPVLADQQGWKVTEVKVNHRARRYGSSRFGIERYVRGALDLVAVVFVGRYEHRPLHLFGGLGIAFTALGFLIGLYLTILKIAGESIGSRPLLFLGILLMVVGVQLLTFGLLAQMVVLARRDRAEAGLKPAQIERSVGFDADPPRSPAEAGSERRATGTSVAG